ncbi:MAG: carbohydrate-binding protein [Parafilimonas sp.]
MPKNCFYIVFGFLMSMAVAKNANAQTHPVTYKGTPYKDSVYKKGAQKIPGKLQCEYYDFGGEGVAFHDVDSINSGSGKLNKPDGSYLHEFRISEAVDISFTKFYTPQIDNTPYNFVQPEKDQLYVGWTKPGEWTKYSIKVKKSGTYQLGLMFTSNKNGKISFSVNDKDVTGPITIPSTYVAADTVAWRQWHHWNYLDNIATIQLKKGIQTFTIHTVELGDMNYDFINFKKVD